MASNLEESNENWRRAYLDPIAGLYAFSSGISLVDLYGGGTSNLVVADLGADFKDMKLKVFKEANVVQEHSIIDVPTGLVSVYMDKTEPRIPGVVVGSGPSLYVYKNLRPFYRYNLPLLKVEKEEEKLWQAVADNQVEFDQLQIRLADLAGNGKSLTVQSYTYIDLPDKDACLDFLGAHKNKVLKRETVVTCLSTLNKSMSEQDAISCVVVGTESSQVLVLDSEAFTLLKTFDIPSVPCFINCTGIYDVSYIVYVACRNGKVYVCKKDSAEVKFSFEVDSHIVGFERVHKSLIIAKMNKNLSCYSMKGKPLWDVELPANVVCTALMDHKSKGFKAVMVGLDSGKVLVYINNNLVDTVTLLGTPQALTFGRYGSEKACLVAILSSGALEVLSFDRDDQYSDQGIVQTPSASQKVKLEIPKKSQLYVDQTKRERENYLDMFQNFQYDIRKIKLAAARSYCQSLDLKVAPVSVDQSAPISLNANVYGVGPTFKMVLSLVNTSGDGSMVGGLKVVLAYPEEEYDIEPRIMSLPVLVPSHKYNFTVRVRCKGSGEQVVQGEVKVFVVKGERPDPVVSAVISMPATDVNVFG